MKRKLKWTLITVVVLLVIGVVAATLAYGPARRLARLIAHDEERLLREALREPGKQHVLVFAFDGVSAAQLKKAIEGGALPTVARQLGGAQSQDGVYPHGYFAPDVYSVLPSTTLAAWAATFTGKPSAENGIPGNEWFERENLTFQAPAPVSVGSNADTVRMLTDDLVGKSLKVQTVYQRADRKAYVSLNPLYRGADVFTAPGAHVVLGILSDLHGLLGGPKEEVYSEIDDESVEVVVENIEQKGLADLQVVYFPGVDLYTHVAAAPLEDQLKFIRETLDHAIAQVLDAYADVLSQTTILLISDHGHTPVMKDDRHALEAGGDDEPTAVITRAGFRLRPKDGVVKAQEDDFQAVVAYQGAMAYVYLADRSTCAEPQQRCDWNKAPRFEEDVLAVARAFHEANSEQGAVPALRGTLDLIFARQPVAVDQPASPYQVFDGQKLVPISDYLAEQPRPELINLEQRMNGLSAGPYGHRAGDVLLLARSSATEPIEDRFYFSDTQYTSWHGSPSAQDSTIPLVMIRASATGAELKAELHAAVGPTPDQLSVTPLLLKLLNVEAQP